ncbi:MAG TPA: Tn3 family transposase [Candidatus Tectomicrobia bacterium]
MPQGEPKRRAYELCTLSTLRDKLRSGDIYLPNSRRYTDPETFLIPRATWPQCKADVCQEVDLDPTGQTRLSDRAQRLKDLLPRVDRILDRSDGIRIEDGELIVPMDDAVDFPESVKALDAQMRRRVHTQLNKGEKLHDLWKFLFFAREGVVRQKYEGGQANQAGCLNLLTNAVIVWNTVFLYWMLSGRKGIQYRKKTWPIFGPSLAHSVRSYSSIR